MEFNLENILRDNIKNLKPYSSARNEFKGKEGVFLDANENAFGSPLKDNYNRYPSRPMLKDQDNDCNRAAKVNRNCFHWHREKSVPRR